MKNKLKKFQKIITELHLEEGLSSTGVAILEGFAVELEIELGQTLPIGGVCNRRELLIEAFDLINVHDGDKEKITKLVDLTLKSINCG
jgi:hypothetical protein